MLPEFFDRIIPNATKVSVYKKYTPGRQDVKLRRVTTDILYTYFVSDGIRLSIKFFGNVPFSLWQINT